MRYLTVAADYIESALRDDLEGPIEPEILNLPKSLCNDLRAWNLEYRAIIPLDQEARANPPIIEMIHELDKRGDTLAKRISSTVEENAKVRYYSEGLLRYLD